jgi:DNA polymerase III sliding clamp (beta) subunit (PCNA family)
MAQFLVVENAAFMDIVKKANTAAAARGEAYEKAAGIVIEFDAETQQVRIRATNLDIFYIEWIDYVEVCDESFRWRVASKLLNAIAQQLPSGTGKTVKFEVLAAKPGKLTGISGTYRVSLPLMDPNTYPHWGIFDPSELELVSGFTSAIQQVEWAASTDEVPANLKGVHFDGARVYATNKIKAAYAALTVPVTESFTIPAGVVAQLVKTNGGGNAKLLYKGDRLLVLPDDHTQIQVICYGGTYLPVQMLWKNPPANWFTVDKGQILEVLNRALPVTQNDRQPGAFIVLGKERLAAYGSSGHDGPTSGDAMAVPGFLDHPRSKYYFTPENLIQAIEAAPSNEVTIQYELDVPKKPWIISAGEQYSAVISPRAIPSGTTDNEE